MPHSYRIQLKPLPGFEWSSLTGNVASAAAYVGSDYMYAFADAWSFSCLKEQASSGFAALGQESVLYNTSYEQILDWSRIDYRVSNYLPAEEALALIRLELAQKRPVLVKGDSFYCGWFPENYGQQHSSNFYLITGYDDLTHQLFCTDVAYMTHHYPQSVSDFSLGFAGELMTMWPTHDQYRPIVQQPSLDEILVRSAERNLAQKQEACPMFESMLQLANKLPELDRLAVEQQQHDGPGSMNRLSLELLYIVQSRMQFVRLLDKLCVEQNQAMCQLVEGFAQSVRSWSLIRSAYLHTFEPRSSRERILDSMATEIHVTAALEREISQSIMHIRRLQHVSDRFQQRMLGES
ncbi:BtrH N-terminal domain-containing protein [Paenibacillus kandeliae]|uniref:BtrH N-terminal domain-containing protein n=1 Tax=Paenibacillus kandeliae TaxID=3231269 RepID=UPI003459A839